MTNRFLRCLFLLAFIGIFATAMFAQSPTLTPYTIQTLAGTGVKSQTGSGGAASAAALYDPYSVTLDSQNNIWVSDNATATAAGLICTVRKIDKATGIITAQYGCKPKASTGASPCGIATYPNSDTSGNGCPAAQSYIKGIRGMKFDSHANLFVSDTSNSNTLIIMNDANHMRYNLTAGGGSGWNGDNGWDGTNLVYGGANKVKMSTPMGIAVDEDGNMYVADRVNNAVRKIIGINPDPTLVSSDGRNATGITVQTIVSAGDETNIGTPDGLTVPTAPSQAADCTVVGATAHSTALNNPYDVVYYNNSLYVADTACNRILKVDKNTTTNTFDQDSPISQIVGSGSGTSDNTFGPALTTATPGPQGLAFDAAGNMYFDTGSRVWMYDAVAAGDGKHYVHQIGGATTVCTTLPDGATPVNAVTDGCPGPQALIQGAQRMTMDSRGNIIWGDQSSTTATSERVRMQANGVQFDFYGNSVTDMSVATLAQRTRFARVHFVAGDSLASFSVTGANSGDFAITLDDGYGHTGAAACKTNNTAGTGVVPDNSQDCVFRIIFNPGDNGARTANFVVNGNAPSTASLVLTAQASNVVTSQPLTITANDQTMTYGGTVPVLTYHTDHDPVTLATPPTCSTEATSASPVGDYAITCSGAADPAYTPITYVAGNLHIGPASVTVIADDKSMLLGGTLPTFTSHLSDAGASFTTAPTCTTTANGTDAGTFAITCSGGAVDTNHSIAGYTNGTLTVQIPGGLVVVNKASLSFSGVPVNTGSSSQMVTLFNNSTSPITVTSATVGTSDFMVSANGCTGTIAPGGTQCNIWVRFVPRSVSASLADALTINYSGQVSPITVPLTGSSIMRLLLSTTSMAFAPTKVGEGSASQMVNVYNQTGVAVNVVTPVITGADFMLSNSTCTGKLDPGAGCNIWVRAVPKSVSSSLTGALTIQADGVDAGTVALSAVGTAPAPAITLNKSTMDFGTVTVNTGSASQIVAVLNNGSTSATIAPVLSDTSNFMISNTTCGSGVPAYGQCYIWVRMTPRSATSLSGTLTVNANGSPVGVVSLSGIGAE